MISTVRGADVAEPGLADPGTRPPWLPAGAARHSGRHGPCCTRRGLLDLLCETLVSGVCGQTLVVLDPRPGTDAREKLELLRVIGTQNLTPAG